ncbi:phage tail sheath family protein [Pseudomonas sp. NPDC086251]|uniref:phage tail sheath family protein n=1 Tax=Pseudomonas sp. NPDC086251 TaxID=3364431 RepID=UPI0038336031
MPVTVSYPGVYIEELNGLSLSVSASATSVPVFAVDTANPYFVKTTRISSWMDYLNKKTTVASAVPVPFDPDDILDVCMRTYFENGGGYCYLIPTPDWVAEVPKLIDATTLVAAGQDITSPVGMLCGTGRCLFAIVDGPTTDLSQATGSAPVSSLVSEFAAIYYPWLLANWTTQAIPPSAVMAGVYCRVDLTRGVWKAPANVTINGGLVPQFAVTDDLQGQYTKGDALNMIRVFNKGGTTVWGARTRLDSDQWRYVPVRRLFDSAERDIKMAMKPAMFEPNSQPTWAEARGSIENYLNKLWQQGALAGARAEEAYFVQVGKDVTMTQDDINQGMMIVKVGMAAVRPAEFIILQFTQDMAQ